MNKKIFCLILLVFFIANVNAYTTDYQISKPDSIISTIEFWHWITIDWEYNGPTTGDDSWKECTFEDSDKNYGINLDLNSAEITMLESFGPVTSTPVCDDYGNPITCTARTTYFFKLKTGYLRQDTDFNIPLKIKGKCGVVEVAPNEEPYEPNSAAVQTTEEGLKEKEEIKESKIFFGSTSDYPIYIDYNYTFTANMSLAYQTPQLTVASRWGKTDRTKNALIEVKSHDPQNNDISDVRLIIPGDCDATLANTPTNEPDVNSEIDLYCQQTGPKLLVVYALNENGLTGYNAFLSYFSDNGSEIDFDLDADLLIESPNTGKFNILWSRLFPVGRNNNGESWIKYEGVKQHFDYRLGAVTSKYITVLKDTGNGLINYPAFQGEFVDSTSFVSIPDSFCPAFGDIRRWDFTYYGKDFRLYYARIKPLCLPGNHKIALTASGKYTNGTPFSLTQDFNFVVLDINFNIASIITTPEDSTVYGIIYGEGNSIDINIVVDNYSPEFAQITDANFVYTENLSEGDYVSDINGCTSSKTEITAVSSTKWKINSHLECTKGHLFAPAVYLNNMPAATIPVSLVFWVNDNKDKLKLESVSMENFYNAELSTYYNPYAAYPDSGYEYSICFPDHYTGPIYTPGTCKDITYYYGHGSMENLAEIPEKKNNIIKFSDYASKTTGAVILPENVPIITKGDLIRFNATAVNLYDQNLSATAVVAITDSQGNEVASLSQSVFNHWEFHDDFIGMMPGLYRFGGILPMKKFDFNVLVFDTDYLKENELYTVTTTVYWTPGEGHLNLDKNPLNNTIITHFYVKGNQDLISNLPETNFIAVIISVLFVLLVLRKK
jgi:hypothetical protein